MTEEKKVVDIASNNAISLDLSETARTNIWINGDCTKVIKLNLTDMNIMARAKAAQSKLEDLQTEANKIASADIPSSIESKEDEEKVDKAIEVFSAIDKKMRDIVDGIFDFPVCDVCCDGGSMYDPINGQYRYEYIIDKLMALYGDSWEKESKKQRAQMKTHTAKYTKKRK